MQQNTYALKGDAEQGTFWQMQDINHHQRFSQSYVTTAIPTTAPTQEDNHSGVADCLESSVFEINDNNDTTI